MASPHVLLLAAPLLLAAGVGAILAAPRAARTHKVLCRPRTSAKAARRHSASLLSKGRQPKKEDSEEEPFPPDSDTIEGPDCGNVKQVIAQWGKAGKVGTAAGKASGAVAAAAAASGVLEVAIEHAEGVGEVLAGEDGEKPESITMAIEKTGADAKDELDAASTALETELEAFKALASGSKMAGADVEAEDLLKLKELTEKTVTAASAAKGAAEDIEGKAASAKKKALESTVTTIRLIKKALADASPALEEAPDVTQKLQWAIKDAEAVATTADGLVADVTALAAKGDEPDPVLEAFAGTMQLKIDAVTESTEELTPMVDELPTDTEALQEEVKKLEEAQQEALGGATLPSVSETLLATEAALIKVQESLTTIKADVRNMVARQKALEELNAEAEKKLA